MFDSFKSGAVSKNKISPSVFVQPMAERESHQLQQHSKQKQFNRQQSSLQQFNQQPPKHQLETNVDIHDTNDIRYSRSNTQVQLQRLSLSASLIDIYFGRHYRSPDVLVVAGLTMILIGLGAILIGVYVYFNEDEFQEMTFLVGFAMAGIGFICCSCRIIFFGPPLFNCCLPIKTVNYNRERRPTNPPFFTAASSAMSTVTCIGVRFNSGRSLSGVSHVIHINKDLDGVSRRTEQCEDNHLKEIIVTHGQSLEPIATIKNGTDEYPPNHIRPVNPTVIQYISKLGSKT